jgi:hypothetical protein
VLFRGLKYVVPLTLIFTMVILSSSYLTVYGESSFDEYRARLFGVFEDLLDVYYEGGDVSPVVDVLNGAIESLYMYRYSGDRSYLDKFNILLDSASSMLPDILVEGRNRVMWSNIYLVSGIIVFVVLVVLGYLYFPRLLFGLWIRFRRGYRVRVRGSRAGRNSMIVNEEVWAVILAIIVVGGVFAVSQAYLSGRVVEPFSELGLLGRYMKIGDYPRDLVVGDNATFYVYVGNHMGRPMYYIVMVKLGDRNSTIDPAPLEPIYTFERILLHNETWIFRVDLPIERPGLNQRIIVELWIYNETIKGIQYHGRWTQLWINVTSV